MRTRRDFIPDEGGLYALLLDNPGALQPALDRAGLRLEQVRLGRRPILYLGATEDSLRRRMKCHLSHDTYRSTFRMSLGAVLAEELNLVARPVPNRAAFAFEQDSERTLSAWIDANVSVAVRVASHALAKEKVLIDVGDPVLNIAGRRRAEDASAIVTLRRRCRGLPFDLRSLN